MRKISRVLITVFAFLFASLLFVSPASAQNANRISRPCSQKTPNEVCIPIDDAGIDCSCRTNVKRGLPEQTVQYVRALAASEGVTNCGTSQPTGGGTLRKAQNAEGFFSLAVSSIENNIICTTAGCGCTNDLVFLGTPPEGKELAYYQGGALGSLAKMTGAIAFVPIHTADFVADVRDSFSHPFASPAYAQGLGFSSLRPILGLWKLFRNLAYFFFVIIFLVIGFMIMFRSKLGGQAAVTMQQALPKIVISLLLVTFSYAIAGLMIDLMYLLIYMMIGLFSGLGSGLTVSDLTTMAFSNHIITNFWSLLSEGSLGTIASSLGAVVGTALDQAGWGTIGGVAGFGAGVVFLLVMIIATLVNMFRIFFALLMAYVTLIFAVVFAPIQLLLGAIPGQNTFGAWIKSLWENLLVFPVVIFFFFCAKYFSGPETFGAGNVGFAPPQLGLQQGSSATFVKAIIQFAILALIPKAVEIAKQLASGKLNIDVGKSMGEFWKQGHGNAVASRVALAVPNLAGGAAVGAYAGKKLGGTTGYKVAGGVLGGAFGALTGTPITAARSIVGSGGHLLSSFAALQASNVIKRNSQRSQIEEKRRQAAIEREKEQAARVKDVQASPQDFDPTHD